MRPIDDELRALIQRWIDEDARDADPRSWPRRHFRDQGVLFLGGNQAWFWFLGLDGRVWAADHDTFGMRLERVSDPAEIRDALADGIRRRPELARLLDDSDR